MDIKGLDYNTQRSKLIMSEYGREIQKMVEYACELPTKEERLKCAKTIIRQMENRNPQLRNSADYEQTLWDHLSPADEVAKREYQTTPLWPSGRSPVRAIEDNARR